MADSDDSKLSVEPPSEATLTPPVTGGEDLLAELGRMMSDRSVFDPAPAIRCKTAPIPEAVSPSVALANDLEAKLRDDLDALLSAFYSHPPPAPVALPEEPVTPASKPAAATPPAQPQPVAPPPVAPPEQPVAAAPPVPAPVVPPEEPVTPAPKPAATAPPAKPQPAASPAVAAVARALAAALVPLHSDYDSLSVGAG